MWTKHFNEEKERKKWNTETDLSLEEESVGEKNGERKIQEGEKWEGGYFIKRLLTINRP